MNRTAIRQWVAASALAFSASTLAIEIGEYQQTEQGNSKGSVLISGLDGVQGDLLVSINTARGPLAYSLEKLNDDQVAIRLGESPEIRSNLSMIINVEAAGSTVGREYKIVGLYPTRGEAPPIKPGFTLPESIVPLRRGVSVTIIPKADIAARDAGAQQVASNQQTTPARSTEDRSALRSNRGQAIPSNEPSELASRQIALNAKPIDVPVEKISEPAPSAAPEQANANSSQDSLAVNRDQDRPEVVVRRKPVASSSEPPTVATGNSAEPLKATIVSSRPKAADVGEAEVDEKVRVQTASLQSPSDSEDDAQSGRPPTVEELLQQAASREGYELLLSYRSPLLDQRLTTWRNPEALSFTQIVQRFRGRLGNVRVNPEAKTIRIIE